MIVLRFTQIAAELIVDWISLETAFAWYREIMTKHDIFP